MNLDQSGQKLHVSVCMRLEEGSSVLYIRKWLV